MFIYKAKNNIQCKKLKPSNIQKPIINSIRIPGNPLYYINQSRIIQRQLYNKGKTVDNVEQLNLYLHDMYIGQSISYSDFPDISVGEVDAAIKLLNDSDVYEDDIIEVIKSKIEEMHQNSKANENAMAEQEKLRIQTVASGLKNKWTVSTRKNCPSIKQEGTFIGDPKNWHIHTDIVTQEHFKRGIGVRYAINTANAIIEAVAYLISEHGLEDSSGIECYRWLRYTLIERHFQDLPVELRHDV